MGIVDTHLHLIALDRFRYPWLDGLPALNRSFDLADYRAEAAPLDIEAMLHMEVDVAEADIAAETAWATGLGHGVVGAIAACRPESPAFPAWLEEAAANPRVRGFRRILHTEPDTLSQAPLFAENLRRLAGVGRPFDLCVLARQLELGRALVRACPDVQFVLDHCGVPDVTSRVLDPWRADIEALARLPNIACKISGIVAYAAPEWRVDDLRPFVEHVVACFGWERVVWGSDWPVCTLTADLTRWVEATRVLVAGASDDERRNLYSANARRLYGL